MSITQEEYDSLEVGDVVKFNQPTVEQNFLFDCPYLTVSHVRDSYNQRMVHYDMTWSRPDRSRTHAHVGMWSPLFNNEHLSMPDYIVERARDNA